MVQRGVFIVLYMAPVMAVHVHHYWYPSGSVFVHGMVSAVSFPVGLFGGKSDVRPPVKLSCRYVSYLCHSSSIHLTQNIITSFLLTIGYHSKSDQLLSLFDGCPLTAGLLSQNIVSAELFSTYL